MKNSMIALAVLAASMCLAGTASAQPVGPDAAGFSQVKGSKAKSAKKHKTALFEAIDVSCEAGKKAPAKVPGKSMPPKPGKKCLTASTEPETTAPDGEPQPATPGETAPTGIKRHA